MTSQTSAKMPAKPGEDEITPQGANGTRVADGAMGASPNADGTDVLTNLQERLEDIREAIVETETYEVLSKRAAAIRRTGASVWSASKRYAWIIGTSVLVLVVPLLYEVDKELGPGFDPNSSANAAASVNPNQSSSSSSTTSVAQPGGGATSAGGSTNTATISTSSKS